ncbi:MAG: transcriptional repressor LexA [Chloroflexi bacterium]|nr:transcriptional repressor LexA [Chloroflexota bacterium]
MKELSTKQKSILKYVQGFIEKKGYPPSVRDIQAACKISSTSVVDYNLRLLERGGFLRRAGEVARGITLGAKAALKRPGIIEVPLLGAIAAGAPIPVPEAETWKQAPEETVEVPEAMVRGKDEVYALRVKGTSMIDALINDGDTVLLRFQKSADRGDMIVAWLKDEKETTLKKYFPEDGRVRLQPANATMKPIYVDPKNLEIQGKVVGVIRGL